MKRRLRPALLLLVLPAVLALRSPQAQALEACTEITAIPATIDAPGHYCLRQDFARYSGGVFAIAIDIRVDDVLLDCNGHTLHDTHPNSNAIGVRIHGIRRGDVVRHCVIRAFANGVLIDGQSAASVPGASNNRIEDNSFVDTVGIAIRGTGRANVYARNRIRGAYTGIWLDDDVGSVVRDNQVCCDTSTAGMAGIVLMRSENVQVLDNTISGLAVTPPAASLGIYGENNQGLMIAGNQVLAALEASPPLDGGNTHGIRLVNADAATNVCVGNTVGHYGVAITGCVQAGNTAY